MRFTKKTAITAIVGIAILAIIVLLQIQRNSDIASNEPQTPSNIKEEAAIPTVFLHGYMGNLMTFQTMVTEFEAKGKSKRNVEITIEPDGQLTFSKEELKSVKEPLIQLYFRNGTASIEDQLTWTKAAMKIIEEIYGSKKVNIVAHSMGGLTATKYIIETSNNDSYPKVDKFVTLASPMNGWEKYVTSNPAEVDLHPASSALADLYSNRHSFPEDIEVFSAYGYQDVLVNRSSAKGLNDYTKNVITAGYMVNHSYIHEDLEIVDSVYTFLEFE